MERDANILHDFVRVSCEYSHPYVEQNYPRAWIERFKIGFLPKGVFDFSKYTPSLLEKLGLYYPDSKFSPFEGRIIFPIYDGRGLISIAGRYPSKNISKGVHKYINTVFPKENFFYTIPEKMLVRGKTTAFVFAEGYTDIMALSDAIELPKWSGLFPAGLMGLSFPERRVKKVNDIGIPIYFFLDGDNAGMDALYNLRDQFQKVNVPIYVFRNTLGLDPEEFWNYFGDLPEPMTYGKFIVEYLYKKQISTKEILECCIKYGFEKEIVEYFG